MVGLWKCGCHLALQHHVESENPKVVQPPLEVRTPWRHQIRRYLTFSGQGGILADRQGLPDPLKTRAQRPSQACSLPQGTVEREIPTLERQRDTSNERLSCESPSTSRPCFEVPNILGVFPHTAGAVAHPVRREAATFLEKI